MSLKRNILLFCTIAFSITINAQSVSDSLKRQLSNENFDTRKIDLIKYI